MTRLYDPHPVLELARLRLADDGWRPDDIHGMPSRIDMVDSGARIADICGVTVRTVQRWRSGGHMTSDTADRVAIHLGLHPALIWDDWLDT